MTNILFVCSNDPAISIIAKTIAKRFAPDGISIKSASTGDSSEISSRAIEILKEIDTEIAPSSLSLLKVSDIDKSDIIITLCNEASESCKVALPGHPLKVCWNLDNLPELDRLAPGSIDSYKILSEKIISLSEDFFKRGYLNSLLKANNNANMVLDTLLEGIIAHDNNRKITFFNSAAEKITGYSREDVLGKDCHDVFNGNFCGSMCSFCDGVPDFGIVRYPIESYTKTGETRDLEMTVRAMKDDSGAMLGIVASFRDLTHEHTLERRLGEAQSFSGIIGRDKVMLEIFDLIKSVADINIPVLVQGESGTGKELVAAAIHNEGNRAKNLFVPVNCGALPEGLLESELFGHVRGAFTGAIRDKKGRFELASGGTIFLDEIGDISLAMQVKLLRVLQDGTFERVGDTRTIKTDVRVISATNKNLQKEIAEGKFREDLYYRLCVVPLTLPPLRERCGDIPLLVDYIRKRVCKEAGKENLKLSASAMDALLSYSWPGNIRELQNALQFAMVKCREETIEAIHLPPHILAAFKNNSPCVEANRINRNLSALESIIDNKGKRNKLTPELVNEALEKTAGNKAKAARVLGVGRATLYRFLEKKG